MQFFSVHAMTRIDSMSSKWSPNRSAGRCDDGGGEGGGGGGGGPQRDVGDEDEERASGERPHYWPATQDNVHHQKSMKQQQQQAKRESRQPPEEELKIDRRMEAGRGEKSFGVCLGRKLLRANFVRNFWSVQAGPHICFSILCGRHLFGWRRVGRRKSRKN